MYQNCPLYAIQSKRMLLQVLGIQDKRWQKHAFVQQNISPYIDGTTKKRLVEAPSPQLKAIQKRIKNALIKCDFPGYVFSGIKGRSYVENAKKHAGKLFVYKIDISAFFPNTSRDKVYRFFQEGLQTSPDVANILTNLCTSDLSREMKKKAEINAFLQEKGIKQINHLCTGASPSPVLSYLVNQVMFDEMKKLCDENNVTMTVYVDDTIFSSEKEISKKIRLELLDIVEKYGYRVSMQKVKYYASSDVKKITGVIIQSSGMMDIPNKLRLKIKNRLISHKKTGEHEDLDKLTGCVAAARQIDNTAYPSVTDYIRKQRVNQKNDSQIKEYPCAPDRRS